MPRIAKRKTALDLVADKIIRTIGAKFRPNRADIVMVNQRLEEGGSRLVTVTFRVHPEPAVVADNTLQTALSID